MPEEERIRYILGLLGNRTETSVVREVSDSARATQFDTLVTMADENLILKDSLVTRTSVDQQEVETAVKAIYDDWLDHGEPLPGLYRDRHAAFVRHAMADALPEGFAALDASHPWMIYWCTNTLAMLGVELDGDLRAAIVANVLSYRDPHGGIGGGVGQLAHAAPTYAGICALALSGDTESWDALDREAIYGWLLALKDRTNGSFVMHVGGECDTRAVYCVLVVASLLDIMTPELTHGVAEWLHSCQTFEGGFGGTPFDEAHGGYTFCAVAALSLLGHPAEMLTKHCDFGLLVRWTVMRQQQLEGGFAGRTNKLVDGCYSHWVGGLAPFLEIVCAASGAATDAATATPTEIISRPALVNYILMCCQSARFPGLVDKPGKRPDYYHTNYVLCGLSSMQHRYSIREPDTGAPDHGPDGPDSPDASAYNYVAAPLRDASVADIRTADTLRAVHPVFGLPLGVAEQMKSFYRARPFRQ